MSLEPPQVNEYQRALFAAAEHSARAEHCYARPGMFRDLPPYGQTPITEWGACLYAKTGEIKAKSWSGLVTFYTRQPLLDWDWLQTFSQDWVCCPQCNRMLPKEPRYWWWRNKEKGYLWLDACRDCKCSTERRVRDKWRM